MSGTAIDFSKYEAAAPAPAAIDFSKYESGKSQTQNAPPKSLYQQGRDAFDTAHGKVGMPGSSEGSGLAGSLSDWDEGSFGEIGGGVKDILSGNVARGLHRIISGGGTLTLPVAAIAAPAAPLTAAGSLVGGVAGGKLAQTGATALGATPDQAALAGDVGGIVGGVAGGGIAAGVKPALNAVGKTATAVGDSLDPDLVGLVSPRAAHALRLANKVGKVATKLGGEAAPEAAAAELDATGQNRPYAGAAPPTQAELDATGENKPFAGGVDEPRPGKPAAPAAVARGQVVDFSKYETAAAPVPPASVAAPPVAVTPKSVQSQLENALGGKPAEPLIKGVSLRNQAAVQKARSLADLSGSAQNAPPTAGASDFTSQLQQSLDKANAGKVPADSTPPPSTVGDLPTQIKKSLQQTESLPEGFTPVESTALKGYKYSPETREFESVTNSGSHYIHGDVSPEEVQTFEDADSKGKAWSKLKSQNPLVAKVVNGNRVAVKPPTSAPAGAEDFSSLLGESLKQAQMRKLAELQ
jgi:hypothetical protein